jgi:hypothetical protein
MNSEKCDPATHASEKRSLFERDWEVFVIKHDEDTGKFKWFTECCERLAAKLTNARQFVSAAGR